MRCSLPSKWMLSIALVTALAAQAKIPAQDALVDDLGASIQGRHIYVLPSGRLVYHGTINVFRQFAARAADQDGMEQGTWFGADIETSAAMSYKKACEQPKLEKQSHLLVVRTLKSFNMILIPWGVTGHDEMAKKIGTRVRNKARMLNGVGVVPASRKLLTDLCKTSVYVDGGNNIVAYTRDGQTCAAGTGIKKDTLEESSGAMAPEHGVACRVVQPVGQPIQLSGWRAPWDQNEIAFCGRETSATTFEITEASLLLPLATVDGKPDKEKTCDPAKAPWRRKLVNVRGGAAFDIAFVDPAFWKGMTTVEGYVSMAKDANDYEVGFTNPHWQTFQALTDVIDRVNKGGRPRIKCVVGNEPCTLEAVHRQSGSPNGSASMKTQGLQVKLGTNTKVVLTPGD
jgi:hypothetical protein